MSPAKLTHEEKIAKFIAKRKAAIRDDDDHTYSKLSVVFRECGWKQRGPANSQQIQSACEKEKIYPEPMLTAPGLAWDETVYFSRAKPSPYVAKHYAPHPAFASEKRMQRFLALNLGTIDGLKHLKDPILEYPLPSGRKIDILCRERRSNALVVIELKKFTGNPVEQIRRYLEEVQEEIAPAESPQPGVKGIVVAGRPSAVLERRLARRITEYEVTWFLCRVELNLLERVVSEPVVLATGDGSQRKI